MSPPESKSDASIGEKKDVAAASSLLSEEKEPSELSVEEENTSAEDLSLENDEESKEKIPLIIARGTGAGLILRFTRLVPKEELFQALREFVQARKQFLEGNEVSLEFTTERPPFEVERELQDILGREFKVTIRTILVRSPQRVSPKSLLSHQAGLSGEVEMLREPDYREEGKAPFPENSPVEEQDRSEVTAQFASDSMLWDKADCKVIYTTLRSGQRIETEHSVIVFGDVNSGAEIIAGGDVMVLGTLRGVAHAGAYEETGGGRVIFALNLQATQLRIGMVITRGIGEHSKVPEVARVEGNTIVVEPYNSRTVFQKGPRGAVR